MVDDPEFFLSCKKIAFKRGVDCLLNFEVLSEEDLKNSEEVFKKTVSIPIYPSLRSEMVDTIIDQTRHFYYGD